MVETADTLEGLGFVFSTAETVLRRLRDDRDNDDNDDNTTKAAAAAAHARALVDVGRSLAAAARGALVQHLGRCSTLFSLRVARLTAMTRVEGPGKHYSPRHRTPFNSGNQGSECVG